MNRLFQVIFFSLFVTQGIAQPKIVKQLPGNLETLLQSRKYPDNVISVLKTAKTNWKQLAEALNYFYATKDTLKIHCINFLIANMPIHYSSNYYWADSLGNRVTYNEVVYPTLNDAVAALEIIKLNKGKLHPVPYNYRDVDSITSAMLIENIELATEAFRKRNYSRNISEQDFLEYVLPYRISIEPMQNWRKVYMESFASEFNEQQSSDSQFIQLKKTVNDGFKNLYSVENRMEPLPRLGALQILLRGKGYCEDMAGMAAFIARSKGIPATIDNVPLWATTSGNHFLNFITIDGTTVPHFDAAQDSLGREPGKVIRTTYSTQKDAIATWLDTAFIPNGFLRVKNYKDVTKEYWPVENVATTLFNVIGRKVNAVYLAVYNSGRWTPIWFGKFSGNTAIFKDMGRGVVYLPMYYIDRKLIPAGWPYALGYANKLSLQPDTLHSHTIIISQQEKYLKFRSGKIYKLYYWKNQWQQLAQKTAPEGCTELVFDKVPGNALLMLIPEYSQGKERPFIITEEGKRVWW